jgi:Domain of unknown function (DUF4412)
MGGKLQPYPHQAITETKHCHIGLLKVSSPTMKNRLMLLLIGALFIPAALTAANFEGKVAMKMTDARGGEHVMNFCLKDGLQRIDLDVGNNTNAATITNYAKHEITILMLGQHMYMVRPIGEPAPVQKTASANEPLPEKTGETEKILGYDCVKYVRKGKDSVTELWTTDQLGRFMGSGDNPMNGMARQGPVGETAGWEKALMGKDFFPLRIVEKGSDGKVRSRMEITSVEKQSLPDSLFTPPPGFKKFDPAEMMRGMGGPGSASGNLPLPRGN